MCQRVSTGVFARDMTIYTRKYISQLDVRLLVDANIISILTHCCWHRVVCTKLNHELLPYIVLFLMHQKDTSVLSGVIYNKIEREIYYKVSTFKPKTSRLRRAQHWRDFGCEKMRKLRKAIVTICWKFDVSCYCEIRLYGINPTYGQWKTSSKGSSLYRNKIF